MGFELTGKKVSLTYNDLVQYISGSYYDGLGNLISIIDVSALSINLVNYIKDSSLGTGFYWSTGKLYIDVSVVAGGVTQAYVDGSLASRDSSINNIINTIDDIYLIDSFVNSSTYYDSSLNNIRANYVGNASLNSTQFIWGKTSPGILDISVAGGTGDVTKAYVDGSFYSNASLGLAFSQYSNASLGLAGTGSGLTRAQIDASFATNVSIGLAFFSNASLGLAFSQYSNASLGYISQLVFVENTSIGLINASLNNTIEASTYFYTRTQIDASFATNASVGLAFFSNASLGLAFSQYSNASLGLAGSGGLSRSQADASYATNVSIGLAFFSNVSLGLAFSQYSNASLGLAGSGGLSRSQADASYATNSSVGLAFYSNASLGYISQLVFVENTSIGLINASLNNTVEASTYFYTRTQIDASFTTNVSVGLAFYSNASLGLAGSGSGLTRAQIDASYATNASIGLAFFSNVSLGNISQLAYALNTSMGSGLTTYATNTSIGLALYSNASLGLAGSGSGLTRDQIDASYATNVSIGLAFASNASLGSSSTKYDKTGGPITGDVSISGILVIGDTTMDTDKLDSFSVYQNESQTDSVNLVKVVGVSDNYLQVYIQNRKNGANASADLVATANNGTEVINYVNVGINSSIFSSGNVGNYNDAYVYSIAQALLIGNASIGTNSNVIFFTNGTNTYANERMRINASGYVGINQNNPAYPLDVSGTAHTTGTISIDTLAVNPSDAVNKYYLDSNASLGLAGGGVSKSYVDASLSSRDALMIALAIAL